MDTISVAAELDRQFGVPGVARVREGNGTLPRVQISGSRGDGEIYLHGAHVTSWKPAAYDEVLFMSTKSRWQEGQAIRGGIPICFPWFRAKANDSQAPAHGFARTRMWQLESAEFRLVHRVTFGTELRLELVCTNTGTAPLRFEEALHTYNRVADVEQVRLQGLDSVHFLDNTDSNTQHAVDLVDPKMHRRIRLRKNNSFTTVVWNPWRDKASELHDLGDGKWRQFLCVEASNILDAAVNLAPGQEHKMIAVLSVEKV